MHAVPRLPLTTRAWRIATSIDWWVIVAGILAVAVLGYRGIRAYCDPALPGAMSGTCTPPPTRSDAAYLTLQLFLWQSGGQFLGPRVGLGLDAARFIAPALASYAAVRALLALFAGQVQRLMARFAREHVIVCGLGPQGMAVARGLRDAGWRVVMLEVDERRRAAFAAQSVGAVIGGDATDPADLRRAGLARARHLIALCGDDHVNAEVVARAAAAATGGGRVLSCHAHVMTPALWERLRPRELAAGRDGASRLQFFSAVDITARAVVAEVLPATDHPAPHLVVAGGGPVAERVLVHAALAWRVLGSRHRLRLTVATGDAASCVTALHAAHPRLRDGCDVIACEFDAGPAGAGPRLTHLLLGQPTVSAICLSGLDDTRLLAWALGVLQATLDDTFPIAVAATREHGLDLLAGDDAAAGGRLSIVGMLERGCSVDAVFGGTHELLARAIHGEYRRAQAAAGQTVASNPSMQPWAMLPEPLRDSNRRQADDIAAKIAAVGCRIVPQSEWDTPAFEFTAAEIEQLARHEHARWLKERRDAHWTYDTVKDVSRLRSPNLKEWADLAAEIKDIDRNTVAHIPQFLARVGLGIRRHAAGRQSADPPLRA
ncbi:MAG: NAD-binding protein [Vicinamibacterales bacterium]